MKKLILPFPLLMMIFAFNMAEAQTETDKYKVVQGLGYLHTQVSLLLNNWEIHPLNDIPMDEIGEEYYDHFLEEFEHDEEWVEFMMVEDQLTQAFGEELSEDVEQAIQENLIFYDEVYQIVKKPGVLTKDLASWKSRLSTAEKRLYEKIFPELIH